MCVCAYVCVCVCVCMYAYITQKGVIEKSIKQIYLSL